MHSVFSREALKGKNILVTGASSGIGRQVALDCARHGAQVWALGRNEERLEETQTLAGVPFIVKSLDLSHYEAVQQWVVELSSIKFHGIVHAAGVTATLPMKFSSANKWEDMLQNNVIGPMHLSQQLLKNQCMGNPSSMVFISSVMAQVGTTGKTLYAASKGAIHAAVKSMAIELASRGIRVNAVAPGVVKTPLSASSPYAKNENDLQTVIDLHPLGLGEVENVSSVILFLLSDASRWVTGANWEVDGGYSAK